MTRGFSGMRTLLQLAAVSAAAAAPQSAPIAAPSLSAGAAAGTASAGQNLTASFVCADRKRIRAVFVTGAHPLVRLDLSDGRHLQLPQAAAASGARYASPDESIVFWNKGRTAFIQEHGERTYSACVQAP